jgi:hypothetical protein
VRLAPQSLISPEDDPDWQQIFVCTEILALPFWDDHLEVAYAAGSQCMERLVDLLAAEPDEQQVFRICRVFASFMAHDLERFVTFGRSQPRLVPALLKNLRFRCFAALSALLTASVPFAICSAPS